MTNSTYAALPIWLISSPFFTSLVAPAIYGDFSRSPSSWALISLVIPLKDSHPWPADMPLCKTSIPKLTIKGTWKSSMCRSGLCGFAWIHWRCEVWSFFPPKKKGGSSSFEPFPNHTSTSVFCVSVRVTSMARRFKQVWKNDVVQLTTGWFQRGVPAWLSSIRASIRGPWNIPGNVLKIWGEAKKKQHC